MSESDKADIISGLSSSSAAKGNGMMFDRGKLEGIERPNDSQHLDSHSIDKMDWVLYTIHRTSPIT